MARPACWWSRRGRTRWPRPSARCSRIGPAAARWGAPDASASRRSSAGAGLPSARARSTPTRSPTSPGRRPRIVAAPSLAALRGFVFDLDGCIWNGDVLNPGANEMLQALHQHGRALAFVSNNSRSTGTDLRVRLHGLGVTVAQHVLTPLEIIGEVIRERFGPS